MTFDQLRQTLQRYPNAFPRFILPSGESIPAHAHVTEVADVTRNFIDCGGITGREEKALLQTHVGDDIDHRLTASRLTKILDLGRRVLTSTDLDVEIEYDCCVVAHYPISEMKPRGDYLDIILGRSRTKCRPRERRAIAAEECCSTTSACCA